MLSQVLFFVSRYLCTINTTVCTIKQICHITREHFFESGPLRLFDGKHLYIQLSSFIHSKKLYWYITTVHYSVHRLFTNLINQHIFKIQDLNKITTTLHLESMHA